MSKKQQEKAMELTIGGHHYKIVELPLTHEDESKELYGRHWQYAQVITC